jgi:hypothetical protein
MDIQTLDARYIDGALLLALLISLFGQGNFNIDVSWPEETCRNKLTNIKLE